MGCTVFKMSPGGGAALPPRFGGGGIVVRFLLIYSVVMGGSVGARAMGVRLPLNGMTHRMAPMASPTMQMAKTC